MREDVNAKQTQTEGKEPSKQEFVMQEQNKTGVKKNRC